MLIYFLPQLRDDFEGKDDDDVFISSFIQVRNTESSHEGYSIKTLDNRNYLRFYGESDLMK